MNARSKVSGTKSNTRRNTRKKVTNKQSQGVTIRRSSGRKETFGTDRMGQTISRSGVPFRMARDIAKTVTKKIGNASPKSHSQDQRNKQKKTSKREKIISAGKVRQLVTEELRDRNRPDIANSYSGNPPENTAKQDYEKTDNK
jgi:transcriptional repressor NrdR